MATLLDIGLLGTFDRLFTFLFIFVIVYAVMTRVKVFGENKGIPALIAFLLAIVGLTSRIVVKTISLMSPWFILFFIFAIFVLVSYQLFGVKEESIVSLWTKGWKSGGSTLFYWILAIVLIIGFSSLLAVLKEEKKPPAVQLNETVAGEAPGYGFWYVILNPKVLGAIVLMLIALFTIKYLSTVPE